MKRLALAFVACLATTTSARAVEAILLAPTQFSRPKGKPQAQAASFTAREDGLARVQLINGDGNGAMAVGSAIVRVNGLDVFVPADFDPRFPTMIQDVPVTEGLNELTVDLRGAPGDFVSISISQELEICPPGIEQCQGITPIPVTQSAAPSSELSISLEYSASSAHTFGLGVRVHWNSSQLHFDGTSSVFPLGLQGVTLELDDLSNHDADPNTDKVITMAWALAAGLWPGANFQTLITLNFTAAPGLVTSTQVNFTTSGVTNGYEFFSTPATVLAP